MSVEEPINLQRLLRPRQAAALLESFARLAPGLGLALVRSDRQVLASAGSWPEDSLRQLSSMDAAPPPASECRYFPLLAGDQQISTLVVRADGSEVHSETARVLHKVLI